VRDENEEIRIALRTQDELQSLQRVTAGHRCVERCPAAGEKEPCAVRKAPVGGYLRQPFGLSGNRFPRLLAVHERYVYTIGRG
jgi:hypothetical protein